MSTIDKKDRQILDVLKDHAEYTTRQIAKKTLLPVTTIHHRIRKLQKFGIIKRYTVDVNHQALDQGLLVYVLVSVNLKYLKSKHKSQYDIASDLRKFYFVERADIVSGGTDLVVLVRVKDVAEYDRCLLTKLQLVEGIERTQSLMVIHGT